MLPFQPKGPSSQSCTSPDPTTLRIVKRKVLSACLARHKTAKTTDYPLDYDTRTNIKRASWEDKLIYHAPLPENLPMSSKKLQSAKAMRPASWNNAPIGLSTALESKPRNGLMVDENCRRVVSCEDVLIECHPNPRTNSSDPHTVQAYTTSEKSHGEFLNVKRTRMLPTQQHPSSESRSPNTQVRFPESNCGKTPLQSTSTSLAPLQPRAISHDGLVPARRYTPRQRAQHMIRSYEIAESPIEAFLLPKACALIRYLSTILSRCPTSVQTLKRPFLNPQRSLWALADIMLLIALSLALIRGGRVLLALLEVAYWICGGIAAVAMLCVAWALLTRGGAGQSRVTAVDCVPAGADQ